MVYVSFFMTLLTHASATVIEPQVHCACHGNKAKINYATLYGNPPQRMISSCVGYHGEECKS
jgi:hypothetical protein